MMQCRFGLRAQHLRHLIESGARQRFAAEIDLHDHGVGRALLDELRQGGGLGAPGRW